MAEIRWAEPALNDLISLVGHIAQDSPAYAERFSLRLLKSTRRLGDFPHSGRVVPEFSEESIRKRIYGSYRIIY